MAVEKIVMATNNSGLNSTYLLISEKRREIKEKEESESRESESYQANS